MSKRKKVVGISGENKQGSKKVARFFRQNRAVTPSVAAPGVNHPSDAAGFSDSVVLAIVHSSL